MSNSGGENCFKNIMMNLMSMIIFSPKRNDIHIYSFIQFFITYIPGWNQLYTHTHTNTHEHTHTYI